MQDRYCRQQPPDSILRRLGKPDRASGIGIAGTDLLGGGGGGRGGAGESANAPAVSWPSRVGAEVGTVVTVLVGARVGAFVGAGVGALVSARVGAGVTSAVGSAVLATRLPGVGAG